MAASNQKNVRIDLHHLTRIEGHGNIVINVSNGVLEQCDLEIVEAPRFFEAMLRGLPYEQASHLASRICGICAVTHATASLRAVENALGVQNSPQTNLLRLLNLYGEILDSHILHVYMLVAPDLLGVGSVIPLAKSAPDVVLRALRMKKLAGDICGFVCGRHTHPIGMTVGGFTHLPTEEQLINLDQRLQDARQDVDATVELFQSLTLPDFERDTEYIALRKDDEYCFMDGEITSTDGGTWPLELYREVTNEFQVAHSTAKHTRHQRQSYMVGALARYNINQDKLHPKARSAANALGLGTKTTNPYMNTTAQVVEIVHCVEESIQTIQSLLENGIKQEEPAKPSRISGGGVGACEAPRGTLYHNYVIKNDIISDANCVIPTAQNLANIEADMHLLVPAILDRPSDEITQQVEMLVRAYDPCISCSAHTMEVTFV
ncbi:MAG TPA: Ni/Fe hydrogenase subunit alpha [Anaerolineales bacterium]|nr:Ni/Fe hydrogenase subunit alpha [Anaerolineales bacterium]